MALATSAILAGCGSGVRPSTVVVTVTAAQQQKIGSVTNFGDSITCGYHATPENGTGNVLSTNGYAGLLDTAIARPAQNVCLSGQQAADMTRVDVYPTAVPVLGASQLYTVMIGTNDANVCGDSDGCLINWSQSLSASLAWLCLPASDKALAANSTSLTGPWTNDLGIGMATSSNGASLSLQVQQAVAGRPLYVAYRVFDPAALTGGTASLSVDGTQQAVLNATNTSGHVIYTQFGLQDTIYLAQVPLGPVGEHTVTLTTTSPNGAFFSVLWAGTATGDYTQVAGAPRVILGQVPISRNGPLTIKVERYNSYLDGIVAGFNADGMNLQLAPTFNAMYPAFDFTDSVHPNNDGHARLAVAFASVL